MHPARFHEDLLAKPTALHHLSAALAPQGELSAALAPLPRLIGADPGPAGSRSTGSRSAGPAPVRRVVLLGMGSSRYAALDAAARLRAAGVDAVAEYASAETGTPAAPDTLVVAVSAGGGSVETLHAVERHRGRSPLVVLTNRPDGALAQLADHVVPMLAGDEAGGVACRTFQHTTLALEALHAHLLGAAGGPAAVRALVDRVHDVTVELLDGRDAWLPELDDLLTGGAGVWTLAGHERLATAHQSALMLREGPRVAAHACETGDWAHVDVYLTKTYDYRALFFAGSRWDDGAWEWLVPRRSTVAVIGADVPAAAREAGLRTMSLRHSADGEPHIARHAETVVAELLAARWWLRSEG